MERVSGNPISTIMGAIQTAVEHVAHTGDGLKHVVNQCGAHGSLPLSVSSYARGRGCDDSEFVIYSRHVHASRCWLHEFYDQNLELAILFPAVANSSHTSVERTEKISSGLRTRRRACCRLGLRGCRLGKGNEPEELGGYRLVSQDSLGITRARLARQRENQRMALLNKINSMQARRWPECAGACCWHLFCSREHLSCLFEHVSGVRKHYQIMRVFQPVGDGATITPSAA